MSFDLGPIKKPMIQESQNMQNNGGGGNLGYMAQGEGEESEEELYEEDTHFLEQSNDVDVVDIAIQDNAEDFDDDIKINLNPKEILNKITNKLFNKHKQD